MAIHPSKRETSAIQGTLLSTEKTIVTGHSHTFLIQDDAITIAGIGKPVFTQGRHINLQDELGFERALLRVWNEEQVNTPKMLSGDYALICEDRNTGVAIAATDKFSTYSLYWGEHQGTTAVATNPVTVMHLLNQPVRLNIDAIFAYAYFHVIPAPMSICQGVTRLEGGELIHIKDGLPPKLEHHWQPDFSRSVHRSFPDEKSRFFQALNDGIQDTIGDTPLNEVGCFLSGGTDSSTISGLTSQLSDSRVKTFSIVFEDERYDERFYSRLASTHFETEHYEHVLTAEESIQTLSVLTRTYEQPFGNSSAIPTYVCSQMARSEGISTMLGGDGGDELYGGNSRYAKAWLLSHYQKLPGFITRRDIKPIASAASMSRFKPIAKVGAYLEQAAVPLPEQLHARYNLLNRLGIQNIFTDTFLQNTADFNPAEFESSVWNQCNADSLINKLLNYDFKFTLCDSDLPKVAKMCSTAGVRAGFPMLSDSVVNHSLGLPPNQKLRGTELRYFFRRALRGFLPDQIIDKSKHGFGMPFGLWLRESPQLNAIARDALKALADRQLIQKSFAEKIFEIGTASEAGYYGTIIWVLMVLELWLRESEFSDWSLNG